MAAELETESLVRIRAATMAAWVKNESHIWSNAGGKALKVVLEMQLCALLVRAHRHWLVRAAMSNVLTCIGF